MASPLDHPALHIEIVNLVAMLSALTDPLFIEIRYGR